MADAIKFTEEELNSLQTLQANYQQITLAMGQISLSKIQLENREQSVLNTLSEVREKENELANNLMRDLKESADKYFKKYTGNNDFWDYMHLIKYYDQSIFKQFKKVLEKNL